VIPKFCLATIRSMSLGRTTFFAFTLLVVACRPSVLSVRDPVLVPVQPLPPALAAAPPSSAERPVSPLLPVAPDAVPPFATLGNTSGPTPKLRDGARRALASKWTARVGKTTFRTTMALEAGNVVIGTHGDSLQGTNEASDAVYVIEGKSGRIIRRIATPGTGDKDVGGIAIDAGFVVFSTDNGQIVKAKLADGSIAWTTKLGGKLRPAPALGDLDGTGANDIIVGDERGVLHALDGDTGKPLWTRDTGSNAYDAAGFIAAAAIADLDKDGRDDVVAGARDGNLVAYRGKDGEEIWRHEGDSGIHASPSLVDLDGDGRMEILASWSYSRIMILDAPTGAVRWEQTLEQDAGGIEGLFGSPVPIPRRAPAKGAIVQATAWWGGKRGGRQRKDGVVDGVVLAGQDGRIFRTNEGRVSSTAIVMDIDDDGNWEAIVGTESGELVALSLELGTRTPLARLGGAIEAAAFAADVDGDGSYELLVASNDGVLTCFTTGSRTKPLIARFRGTSAANRGDLGAIALGWENEPPGEDRDAAPEVEDN